VAAEKSVELDDKTFGNMIKEEIDRINAEEKAGNVAERCIGKTRQLSLRFSYISLSLTTYNHSSRRAPLLRQGARLLL